MDYYYTYNIDFGLFGLNNNYFLGDCENRNFDYDHTQDHILNRFIVLSSLFKQLENIIYFFIIIVSIQKL
jgi:hypothetical protein